jgi:ATP-dependent Clp protease adaptor protein ClpS
MVSWVESGEAEMDENVSSTVIEPLCETVRRRRQRQDKRPRRQPRYQVILWNDEHHTYEYVIVMLQELFGHAPERGFLLAEEVDLQGRAIVLTTTLEHAELKRDQIHAYGRDPLIETCKGSMWATIEPMPGE